MRHLKVVAVKSCYMVSLETSDYGKLFVVGPPSPYVCRGFHLVQDSKHLLGSGSLCKCKKAPSFLDVSCIRILLKQKFWLFHVCLPEFARQEVSRSSTWKQTLLLVWTGTTAFSVHMWKPCCTMWGEMLANSTPVPTGISDEGH
jgi:hypothetical protein